MNISTFFNQNMRAIGSAMQGVGSGLTQYARQQEAKEIAKQREQDTMAYSRIRNDYVQYERETIREYEQLLNSFSTAEEMQQFDPDGWLSERFNKFSQGFSEQYKDRPDFVEKIMIDYDGWRMNAEDKVIDFTRDVYRERTQSDIRSTFTTAIENMDAGTVSALAQSYRELLEDPELSQYTRLGFNLQQINQMERDALDSISEFNIMLMAEELTPTAAREWVRNGEDEIFQGLSTLKRYDIAEKAFSQQGARMSEYDAINNQRISDQFFEIAEMNNVGEFYKLRENLMKADLSGVKDGEPFGYMHQPTQARWLNMINASIDRLEYEAMQAEEIANRVIPEPEPEPEPDMFKENLAIEILSNRVTNTDAQNRIAEGLATGTITYSDATQLLSMNDNRNPSPGLDAAFRLIDQRFDKSRPDQLLQNERVRARLIQIQRQMAQDLGLGFTSIVEFTSEQWMQAAQNAIEHERGSRIDFMVTHDGVSASMLGTAGMGTLSTGYTKTHSESFVYSIDQGKFLGLEQDPVYRERALQVGQQFSETVNQKINDPNLTRRRGENHLFGILAPIGTQINTQDIILTHGLRSMVFIESPYQSPYTVTLADGRTGVMITPSMNQDWNDIGASIYNPKSGGSGSSASDYLPLWDPQVANELRRAVQQYELNNARQNQQQIMTGATGL